MSEHSTQPQEFFPPPLHTCATYIYVCAKIPMFACYYYFFCMVWSISNITDHQCSTLRSESRNIIKATNVCKAEYAGGHWLHIVHMYGPRGRLLLFAGRHFFLQKTAESLHDNTCASASASGSSGLNVTDDTNEVYDSLWPRDARFTQPRDHSFAQPCIVTTKMFSSCKS